jgi:hypothetical protein
LAKRIRAAASPAEINSQAPVVGASEIEIVASSQAVREVLTAFRTLAKLEPRRQVDERAGTHRSAHDLPLEGRSRNDHLGFNESIGRNAAGTLGRRRSINGQLAPFHCSSFVLLVRRRAAAVGGVGFVAEQKYADGLLSRGMH